MSITSSTRKKERILYLSRAAGFYQAEFWAALWEMERLLGSEDQPEWDAVKRLYEVVSISSGKDLYLSDLRFFLSGLHPYRSEQVFDMVLTAKIEDQLLTQLRKANWIHGELCRASRLIARAIGDVDRLEVFNEFFELVLRDGDGYLVTMEEACSFFLRKDSPDPTAVGSRRK